ncbi:MAG: hypothetical protein F4Y28_09425 [Acidimicrobiia bacterium]|nr:hypothetical protein [Acidimicrobiia bacterium]MYG59396.1 hypothetical protein [Acidimicrobiia bacterium]MYJ32690.1 hypothetical protein [Acidimicrobiia bacterium]
MANGDDRGSRIGVWGKAVAWYWDLNWALVGASRRERKEIREWQRYWDLVWAEALDTQPGDKDLPRYYRHRDHRMLDGRAERHVMFTLSSGTRRTAGELAAAVDRLDLGMDDPVKLDFDETLHPRQGSAFQLYVTVLDTSSQSQPTAAGRYPAGKIAGIAAAGGWAALLFGVGGAVGGWAVVGDDPGRAADMARMMVVPFALWTGLAVVGMVALERKNAGNAGDLGVDAPDTGWVVLWLRGLAPLLAVPTVVATAAVAAHDIGAGWSEPALVAAVAAVGMGMGTLFSFTWRLFDLIKG